LISLQPQISPFFSILAEPFLSIPLLRSFAIQAFGLVACVIKALVSSWNGLIETKCGEKKAKAEA